MTFHWASRIYTGIWTSMVSRLHHLPSTYRATQSPWRIQPAKDWRPHRIRMENPHIETAVIAHLRNSSIAPANERDV